MKTTNAAKPKPYEVPLSFRLACREYKIPPMRALQQFVDVVTIKAYTGGNASALAGMACDFLRFCARTTLKSKYQKDVFFYKHDYSLECLQKIEALRQSDEKPSKKQRLINDRICTWHTYIDNGKSPDFMSSPYYRVKMTREFMMLCEALLLNADYVLFLYMLHVNTSREVSRRRKKATTLCTAFFKRASKHKGRLYRPMQQVLECLDRRY